MSPATSTSTTSRPRLSQIFKRRQPSSSSTDPPSRAILAKDTHESNPSSPQLLTPNGKHTQRPSLSPSLSPSNSQSFFSRSNSNQPKLEDVGSDNPLLQIQYHDQVALDAFKEALDQDVGISAASDFAPIRERTSKRRQKNKNSIDSGTREGFVYNLLRFPLLLAIFLTIFLEFMAYVVTRQIV